MKHMKNITTPQPELGEKIVSSAYDHKPTKADLKNITIEQSLQSFERLKAYTASRVWSTGIKNNVPLQTVATYRKTLNR